MGWAVIVYESRRGEKSVEEFLKSLEKSSIAKATHLLDLLEKHGPFLGPPHSKKISKNLYELRIRGRQEIRIFYSFAGNKIYLLSAFQKQSRKTPKREIETAYERLKDIT